MRVGHHGDVRRDEGRGRRQGGGGGGASSARRQRIARGDTQRAKVPHCRARPERDVRGVRGDEAPTADVRARPPGGDLPAREAASLQAGGHRTLRAVHRRPRARQLVQRADGPGGSAEAAGGADRDARQGAFRGASGRGGAGEGGAARVRGRRLPDRARRRFRHRVGIRHAADGGDGAGRGPARDAADEQREHPRRDRVPVVEEAGVEREGEGDGRVMTTELRRVDRSPSSRNVFALRVSRRHAASASARTRRENASLAIFPPGA
mmetsp:Transcript_2490/g.7945  ORF Transcript_2490/g.7945 Transcript_2490/m.7945 type:complete len:265 (+) Transcript_2490:1581-2375(+)